MSKMKKVVVTGATSMVGVALIEECIRNEVYVLALVRKKSRKINRLPVSKFVSFSECDLEEMNQYVVKQNDYDVFYHFGWSNTDKEGRSDVRKQYENIEYCLNAMELAEKLGCKKFVGAGSQAEYGIHLERKTNPQSALNPQDAYGVAKAAAGKLCSIEATRRNIDFSWVRIFSLFGKYELPETLIQTMIPRMLKDERCALTEGTQNWDYLYSADAGEAFYLVGERAVGNNFYCLGSGHAQPLKQYVEIMKDVLNSKSELGFGDIPYIGKKSNGMCADILALQNDVGWSPKTSFAEGILLEAERLKGM